MTTADFRRFGLSKEEAVLVFTRVASLPLDPELEERLAMAAQAVQRGWWTTPRGLWRRWQFHRWQRGARR